VALKAGGETTSARTCRRRFSAGDTPPACPICGDVCCGAPRRIVVSPRGCEEGRQRRVTTLVLGVVA
jgi:hypothetical protein